MAQVRALVTGGAQRIGRAIVADLAAHGFAVAIHANGSAVAAEALAAELSGGGARAVALTADLADAAAVAGLVPAAAAALGGPLDILVNNASMFEDDGPAFSPDAFRRHMAVNAEAPAALAAALAAAGPGLVVNIVDQRVWKPTPGYLSYGASKATLWWLTRTLAQALAPRVRVCAIGPGPTLRSARQTDAEFAALIGTLPLRRGPELAEFGRTIRFLWDTPSVTGQMLALDGGQHLAWETPDACIAE